MPLREPNPDEIQKIRAKGFDASKYQVDDTTGDVFEKQPEQIPADTVTGSAEQNSGSSPGRAAYTGFVKAAIPAATGGATAATVGAFLGGLGGPAAPITVPLGALTAGAAATYLTSKMQDKALNKIASTYPDGSIAKLQKASEQDVQEHPYISTAGSLPASYFGGGSLIPSVKSLVQSPVQAAKMSAIQGGMDIAQQKILEGGDWDPTRTAIATLGGPLFAGKEPPIRTSATPMEQRGYNVGRRVMGAEPVQTEAPPPEDANAALTAMGGNQPPPQQSLLLGQRPNFNPQDFAEATPDLIKDIRGKATGHTAKFLETLEDLKRKMPTVDKNMVARLANAVDPAKEGLAIKMENMPSLAKQQAEVEKQQQVDADEQKMKTAIDARLAAEEQIKKQQAAEEQTALAGTQQAIQGAKEAVQQNEPAVKSAEQSAQAITAATPKVEDKTLKSFADREAKLRKIEAQFADYQEGTPEREMLTRYLTQQRRVLDSDVAKYFETRGAPEVPSAVGTEEAVRPRKMEEVEPHEEETGGESETPPENVVPIKPTEGEAAIAAKEGETPQKEAVEQRTEAPPPVVTNVPKQGEGLSDYIQRRYKEEKAAGKAGTRLSGRDRARFTAEYNTGTVALKRAPAEGQTESEKQMALIRSNIESHPNWDEYAAENLKEKVGDVEQQREPTAADYEDFLSLLPKNDQELIRRNAQNGKETLPKTLLKKTLTNEETKKSSAANEKGPQTVSPSDQALGIKAQGLFNPVAALKAPIEGLRKLVQPLTARINTAYGKLGERFSKALEATHQEKESSDGKAQQYLQTGQKGLSEEQQVKIGDYLKDLRDKGSSTIILTPEERAGAKVLQDLVNQTGKEKESGAFVKAILPSGEHIERPFEQQDNFFPKIRSEEVASARSNPEKNPEFSEQVREEQVQHIMKETGISHEAAEEWYKQSLPNRIGEGGPNPFFKGSRFESGVGIPRAHEESNPFKAMAKYLNNHYQDLAYFHNIESDPVLAKALGHDTTGRGEAVSEHIEFAGKEVKPGQLVGKATSNALRDYVGGTNTSVQGLEKWLGLTHVLKMGPVTQLRNTVSNLASLPGLVEPKDYGTALKAVKDLFTGDYEKAYNKAIGSGSVRPSRNIMPTVALDLGGKIAQIHDIAGRYTGAEAIAKVNDVAIDAIGRAVAKNRILQGDRAFLEKWGPPNWQGKSLDKILDYAGYKFTKALSGAYNATDLPSGLLRGTNSISAFLGKLMRWPVSRFNKWYEHEYTEATKGNLTPLLTQMGGAILGGGAINMLNQALFNRKPDELTMGEWLKLNDKNGVPNKETAYDLFSKMAAVAPAGLLNDIALSGLEVANHQYPTGYRNLLLQSVSNLITRAGQFADALSKGDVSFGDGMWKLLSESAKDNIQVARLFDEKPDKGAREEAIAKRLGYMAPSSFEAPGLNNPFSEAQAYKDNDSEALAEIFARKRAAGQKISLPDTELRSSRMIVNGRREGYYDLVSEMQGEKAAEEAKQRDRENTRKKYQTYSSAMREMRR